MTNSTTAPETRQPTRAELRAEADRLEREAAALNKGKVYIHRNGSFLIVHDGSSLDESIASEGKRELTEAEVQAMRLIPEFNSAIKSLRGVA